MRKRRLADAVAARATAQNEIADLTKQISEAKLAVSGAQEEANAKTRDLQTVEAKLKGENDQSTALEGQDRRSPSAIGRRATTGRRSDAEARGSPGQGAGRATRRRFGRQVRRRA